MGDGGEGRFWLSAVAGGLGFLLGICLSYGAASLCGQAGIVPAALADSPWVAAALIVGGGLVGAAAGVYLANRGGSPKD
jgi:hypothetical protein